MSERGYVQSTFTCSSGVIRLPKRNVSNELEGQGGNNGVKSVKESQNHRDKGKFKGGKDTKEGRSRRALVGLTDAIKDPLLLLLP